MNPYQSENSSVSNSKQPTFGKFQLSDVFSLLLRGCLIAFPTVYVLQEVFYRMGAEDRAHAIIGLLLEGFRYGQFLIPALALFLSMPNVENKAWNVFTKAALASLLFLCMRAGPLLVAFLMLTTRSWD